MKLSDYFKNFVFILVGAGCYFGLNRLLGIQTVFDRIDITYSQPLLMLISVINGPVIGGLAGGFGELFVQLGHFTIDWLMIGCTILSSVMIGIFMRSSGINDGFFDRSAGLRFDRYQFMTNFVVWFAIFPILNVLIHKTDPRPIFEQGFFIATNNSVSCMLITSLGLAMYAKTRLSAANFYRS